MPNMHGWTTGISKIVSDGEDEDLIIYGHRLTKLIGQKSFVESTYLMMTGRLPTPGQSATLDALMTAAIDHALTAAAMIPRSFASYGTSTTAALAAGILLFGNVAGGAGAPLARAEAKIALEALLLYLPSLRPTAQPVTWLDSFFVRGPKTLPLAFAGV